MAKKKKPARRYSDEDRAGALAALAANGGNVQRTADQLGIPETTLRQWARQRRHPEAAQMSEEKKPELADRLEELAGLLVGDLLDPDRRRGASYQQLATATGIAIDKAQLLRGKPTAITDNTHAHDLLSLTDEQLARIIQEDEPEAGSGSRAASPKKVS